MTPPARRIVLVGPPGSGKSYVAQRLSERFGVPWHDLNDHRLGDLRALQIAYQREVLAHPRWICEHVTLGPWRAIYQAADRIYLIQPRVCLRDARILMRHWQKLRGIPFKGHPPPRWPLLARVLRINHRYDRFIYPQLVNDLADFSRRVVRVRRNTDVLRDFGVFTPPARPARIRSLKRRPGRHPQRGRR
ncbi:MAG: AAA family ATPase [Thermaerobacter sp.]|nr:AAA family ATPase [Thermaerobacter sp.]